MCPCCASVSGDLWLNLDLLVDKKTKAHDKVISKASSEWDYKINEC